MNAKDSGGHAEPQAADNRRWTMDTESYLPVGYQPTFGNLRFTYPATGLTYCVLSDAVRLPILHAAKEGTSIPTKTRSITHIATYLSLVAQSIGTYVS